MRQIKTLTSLRFFCAAGVVFYHLRPRGEVVTQIFESCNFAHLVSFFFILSGFVLTLNYKNISDDKQYCRFYLSRLFRIWPAHLAALFLLLFLVPEVFDARGSNLGNFLWNALLLHSWNLRPDIYFSFNSASWSNSTELFFYSIFPILILGLRRKPGFTFLAVLLCLLVPLLLASYLKMPYFDLKKMSSHGLLYVFPPTRLLEFFSGLLLARRWLTLTERKIHEAGLLTKISNQHFGIFKNDMVVTLLATLCELVLIANVVVASSMSNTLELFLSGIICKPLACWFCNCLFPIIGWSLLIFLFAFERGLVSYLLKLPMLLYLGEISFTIYMLHGVLLTWQEVHAPQDMKPLSVLVFWLVLILFSHIVSRGFEFPVRHFALTYYEKLAAKDAWKIAWRKAAADWRTRYFHKTYWITVWWPILVSFTLLWLYLPSNTYFPLPASPKEPYAYSRIKPNSSLRLLAGSARRLSHGVEICLSWQTAERRTIDFFETVLLSCADGNVICTQTHSSDVWKTMVSAGTRWKEKFVVSVPPKEKISVVKIFLTANRKLVPVMCSEQPHSDALETILIGVDK